MKKSLLIFSLLLVIGLIHGQACFKNALYSNETAPLVSNEYITKAVFGDLNNDSKTDMVAYTLLSGSIIFSIQQPDMTIQKTDSLYYDNSMSNLKLQIIDMDNNGTQDVAALLDYGVLMIYTDGAGHISSLDTILQGNNAYTFAAGDYDDDGINDVIISTSPTYAMKVYKGTGASNFILKDSIYAGVGYIRITDMNNDGKNDIVYQGQNYLASQYEDGGIFSKDSNDSLVHVYSLPENLWAYMRTADLNNDSLPDIQLSDGDGFMNYKNDGNFGFTITERVDYMPNRWFDIGGWFLNDIDSDGDEDIILSVADHTVIHLNNAGIIDSINYATFTTPNTVLGIADMNGDGQSDIVMQENNPSYRTYTFLNKGSGKFEGADLMLANGDAITKIKSVELNNDGFPEIAILDVGGVSIYHNNRNRTWEFRNSLSGGSAYNYFLDFDIGFLDADSINDVAVLAKGATDNAVYTYYDEEGTFKPEVQNSVKTLVVDVNANLVGLADFNNDGKKDVLITVEDPGSGGFLNPYMVVYLNDGNGDFNTPTYCLPSIFPGTVNPESDLTVVDFDHDNDQDVFFLSEGKLAFFKGQGGTNFDNPVYIGIWGAGKYLLKDVNNDTFIDAVVLSYNDTLKTYLGSQAGFTFNNFMLVPLGITEIAAGDINNDGNIDIIGTNITNNSNNEINILLGQGTGNFIANSSIPSNYTGGIGRVLSTDLDNDGNTDIVATGNPLFIGDDSRLYFYYNDTLQVNIPTVPNFCSDRELIVQATNGSTINWFKNGTNLGQPNVNPLSVSQTGIYSVTVINSYGCSLTSDSIPIIVSSCDSVWPGDANMNLICDGTDLLAVGVNYGATGIARSIQDNTWTAHDASDWGIINNGLDIKFSDCNGDGSIDANDTLAINQNFTLIHNLAPIVGDGIRSDPSISFVTSGSTYLSGQYVDVDVWLGSSTNPVFNLYGIAFDINFDASLAETGTESLIYSNSWLAIPGGNAIKIGKINSSANTAHGAITRIDHINADGFGKIATFRFQTSNSIITTTPMNFSISGYMANDSSGAPLLFSSAPHTIIIAPLSTAVDEINNSINLVVYPNPYSEYTNLLYTLTQRSNVIIEIYNTIGQKVETLVNANQTVGEYKYSFSAKENGFDAGIYFVKLMVDGKVGMKRLVELKY